MIKISATIITFNEEKNLADCLASLGGLVDEIVVVDSHSTDNTENIARKFGARFIRHDFEGHIQQKNVAVDEAQNDWILSLDADERLSSEMQERVHLIKSQNHFTGKAYSFHRLSNYCGSWVKHGGWYPDRKVRLFNRKEGRWDGQNPHDRWEVQTGVEVVKCKEDILHYTFYSSLEHLNQIEKFSSIAAKSMFNMGRRAGVWTPYVKAFAKFIRNFLIHRGFLDGAIGRTLAWRSAQATFLRYKKLRKLQSGGSI